MTVKDVQSALGVTPDGDFGPVTTGAAEKALGIKPLSARLPERLKRIQGFLGVAMDGIFGPVSLAALYAKITPFEKSDSGFGNLIATAAEAEIGVSEEGGNNMGERVNAYKTATWLDPDKPWAWCAAFVCFCVREALGEDKIDGFTRPRTAGAWDLEVSWASGKYGPVPGVEIIRKPHLAQRGDIAIYKFSHCGIVAQPFNNGYIRAIEGNTNQAGSREGDGVFSKVRSASKFRSLIRINH